MAKSNYCTNYGVSSKTDRQSHQDTDGNREPRHYCALQVCYNKGINLHSVTLSHANCSDGIGRTGTFICIYSQLERLKAEGVVDVFQSIKASRLQRSLMVTNTVSE